MRYAHLYRVANLCGDALRVVIHPNRSKMLHEVPRVPETRIQKLQSLRRDDYKVVLTLVANAVRGGRYPETCIAECWARNETERDGSHLLSAWYITWIGE